jgi:thiamine-phosphate pyrophosphorylase
LRFNRKQLLLYAVTDRSWLNGRPLEQVLEEALRGGVTLVQLREKNLESDAFLKEAIRIRDLCHQYGVPLIINDNLDVAAQCSADGIHVGMEDLPVAEIRRRMGRDFIIGATAKTVGQAQAAEAAGADYLGVGAVYPSPTKQNARRITREELAEISTSVSIPIVAIGGITEENLPSLADSGIAGAAVVSAIFAQKDPGQAAQNLRSILKNIVK